MATTWTDLPTDYTDATWSGNRKFEMTENSDGTVSFEDVTEYTNQANSYFGADDANQINAAINDIVNNLDNYLPFTLAIVDDSYGYYDTDGSFHSFRQPTGDAVASNVLSGKTFANADSDSLTGTMTNKSGTTTSATASLDSTNSYLKMKVPTTGYYTTSSYLYATYSTIASLISLTAAKIVKGTTILGITGTYTTESSSPITAATVLSGYIGYVNGSKITGSMTNKQGSTVGTADVTLDSSNSRVKYSVPTAGCYSTSSYIYSTYSKVASAISLTAAKIRTGYTVLGITGTGTWTRQNLTSYTFYRSSSSYESDGTKTFTIPSGATGAYVYYSGGSFAYSTSGECTCEIYQNDTLIDSRNIDGDYYYRGTMYGSSCKFSASAGDVIKVVTARSAGVVVSFMMAEIIYYV